MKQSVNLMYDSGTLIGKQYCNRLFAIEKELAGFTWKNVIQNVWSRQNLFWTSFGHGWFLRCPILEKHLWQSSAVHPEPMEMAEKLLAGRPEISNNRVECSIKPFVIDLKELLFTNIPRGAWASVTAFSIIETAKENGLNPFEYLICIFQNVSNRNVQNCVENTTSLLPDAFKAAYP